MTLTWYCVCLEWTTHTTIHTTSQLARSSKYLCSGAVFERGFAEMFHHQVRLNWMKVVFGLMKIDFVFGPFSSRCRLCFTFSASVGSWRTHTANWGPAFTCLIKCLLFYAQIKLFSLAKYSLHLFGSYQNPFNVPLLIFGDMVCCSSLKTL